MSEIVRIAVKAMRMMLREKEDLELVLQNKSTKKAQSCHA